MEDTEEQQQGANGESLYGMGPDRLQPSPVGDALESEQVDHVAPLREQASPYVQPATALNQAAHSHPHPLNINTAHTPTSTISSTTSNPIWTPGSARSRSSLNSYEPGVSTPLSTTTSATTRSSRPQNVRMPSHAYAPPRRPSQYILSQSSKRRSNSANRSRLNPDADYRAQKKAYVQRLQQDSADDIVVSPDDNYPPSLDYSDASEVEDESPQTENYVDNDMDEQEVMLFYNEGTQPSVEELKIPANRERLEWHSMLSNVLTGDVVRQEKRRMTGAPDVAGNNSLQTEIWTGIRAKVCGRSLAAQKRLIESQRSKIASLLEEIITFEIQGEAEVGKNAVEQVQDVVKKIERLESLYPTRQALETAHPRAASKHFHETCDAVVSWHNTTALINTQLSILQAWVGNDELDFAKPRETKNGPGDRLTDESSFVDRILKEDGLRSLQGDNSILLELEMVIGKAKNALIDNANFFAGKHLPPYIEELLTLINFPTRLVQEIIRTRLQYTFRMKNAAMQSAMMAEQLIGQFQILLTLAVKTKDAYLVVSQPEAGWELPPCIDENFDSVVLDALKFYFKLLERKLASNKNTFKEAEILEQEWDFASDLGRQFEKGDVEVAEQFGLLTSRSLSRLTTHFEMELKRRPNEQAGPEMDRRYKQILDSVRVRQRKLFRFSRLLSQTFENSIEYSIGIDPDHIHEIYDNLMSSGHSLVEPTGGSKEDGVLIFASPTLKNARDIADLLRMAYRLEDPVDHLINAYVLVLTPEMKVEWEGRSICVEMRLPKIDLKPGKLRLVAGGANNVLQNAKIEFVHAIGSELDVIIPQRANLAKVDKKLQEIRRTSYKLSNTIMDSVEIIRNQLSGLECQELIQTCFAFATEFGQRSMLYMDSQRRAMNNIRLTRLALDWVSFICDDCIATDRKTFRWAVVALEFAMVMTRGQNILSLSDTEYAALRMKVAGCMSLLISHFDIMGARSTVAAHQESQRKMDALGGKIDISKLKNDEESSAIIEGQRMEKLEQLEDLRSTQTAERHPVGRVLEGSSEADRSLTFLSSSATNVTMRWQQGQYIGGGTFGSVYAAYNLDTGTLMAVKEIRLQDPQLIPSIVGQIRDEMSVLQILDHPNIVSYHGIEVHRDKVYIFMEYCSGGSFASLLEHGRIEDETVIQIYALQLLEGLAYLHESGVVHRDIKPENILLDHNGVVKYVDFGAAKVIARQSGTKAVGGGDQPIGRQRSMTGTPMYMSPEVIKGTASSGSSTPFGTTNGANGNGSTTPARPSAVDIWSLGCVVLQMATGRRPWASLDNEWAIMYNIAQGFPPKLPTRDELSEAGIDFLLKCFERDPARRATAFELLQHEWIMELRNQLALDTASAQALGTPTSETAGSSVPGSAAATRQNTNVY